MKIGTMRLRDETIGGFTAGVAGTVLGFPLDLVKTRMQTSLSSPGMRSSSVFTVMQGIISREGYFALYKGMTPPLISLCILNTVNFTSYATFRTFYSAQKGWDVRNGFAGATAAPIAASISTVDNFIKTQMQVDNISRKQYRNSLHCFRILLKENGVKILYTGLSVNTLREAVFLGSYFCCYEGICASLIRNSFPAPVAVPTAGGLAGALGWLCSFPLDCIRARVQGQTIVQARNVRRKTAVAIAESLLNERGLIGLYSGVTPSIVRAFLVSGVRFSAYEFAIKFLTGSRPDVESPPCLLEGGEQWGTSG